MTSYDVAVVGAGIVGLSCAWAAARRGMSVLVADRDEPGSGASGVAAGMLAPVTEAVFGEEALLRLNLEAARLWPGFAARLAETSGLDTSYRESGTLMVAADSDDLEELRRIHELQRSHDLPAEWLSGRRCREREPGLSPRARGGIAAPDHSVDPRAAVRALRVAAEADGVELLTADAREVVAGRIDARHVVV